MKFKYGDTLRIRNDLYTILGKIRYIDTRRRIWCKYKLVKHKNNAEFSFSRYEEYEDDNGTHILTIEKRVHTTEYSKGVYVDKEYVSIESDVEIPKPILDKMDTIKKMRFIGPIIWFLANLLNNKR